ncbi:MAG: heterodisulfide reductase-related iron-sulfur binding cluster [bacterium]|nr:heterodisulfide reductase-related iron-sulfur binding cluster [bacterium]
MDRFLSKSRLILALAGVFFLASSLFAAEEPKPKTGPELYQRFCAACHGEKGRTYQPNIGVKQAGSEVIPSLDTESFRRALTTDEFKDIFDRKKIIETIWNGSEVKGTESTTSMPAFKEKLTPAEIDLILNYLATLSGQRPTRYSAGRLAFLIGILIFLGGAIGAAYMLSRPDFPDSALIPIANLETRQIMEPNACTRCGECVAWCPVYAIDNEPRLTAREKCTRFRQMVKEQQGPLARWLGINPVSKGRVEEFHKFLLECSTCGQCHIVCPAAIDTVDLWENMRRSFVDGGQPVLPAQQTLIASVKAYDNPWQQPRSSRGKWASRAKREKRITAEPKNLAKEKAEVLYFVGCTASYDVNVKEVAINTTRVLNKAGVDFGILGNEERCCGSVLLRMGDYEFERLAGQNIETFNNLGIKTLITSCSGCYKTIKQDYPRVGKLNFEVLHMTEFVMRLIKEGKLKLKKPVNLSVTYHDPCHLGRANQLFDVPREVLKSIPGIEFREIERFGEFSRCCGAGGGLKAGYREVQEEMARTRVKDAIKTGATEFVTACPFCYQALLTGIQGLNAPLNMRDINELIIMSLEDEPGEKPAQPEKVEPEKPA